MIVRKKHSHSIFTGIRACMEDIWGLLFNNITFHLSKTGFLGVYPADTCAK